MMVRALRLAVAAGEEVEGGPRGEALARTHRTVNLCTRGPLCLDRVRQHTLLDYPHHNPGIDIYILLCFETAEFLVSDTAGKQTLARSFHPYDEQAD